jgi:hypothetical protein
MSDTSNETAGDILNRMETDAQKWAQTFLETCNGISERDGTPFADLLSEEGWLIGWFANAIGAGEQAGRQAAIKKVCTCTIDPPFHDTRCPAHAIVFGWPEPVKNPAHSPVVSD